MSRKRLLSFVIVCLVLVIGLIIIFGLRKEKKVMTSYSVSSDLKLSSPAFASEATIPITYTCKGQNINPPLQMSDIPNGTASLALILHDPDAPSGDFIHWLLWNIAPDARQIAANSVPVGSTQGTNDAGKTSYIGPCPPSGTHRYMFELYALNKKLSLPENSSASELKKAMLGNTLGQTTYIGIFGAD